MNHARMLNGMRLSKLNTSGFMVPILPIVGVMLLSLGIAIAVSLANNRRDSTDIRSNASEGSEFTVVPSDNPSLRTPSPSPTTSGPKRNFSDLIGR